MKKSVNDFMHRGELISLLNEALYSWKSCVELLLDIKIETNLYGMNKVQLLLNDTMKNYLNRIKEIKIQLENLEISRKDILNKRK